MSRRVTMSIDDKRDLIMSELGRRIPSRNACFERANNILQLAMDPEFTTDDVYEMLIPMRGGHTGINDDLDRRRSAIVIARICRR